MSAQAATADIRQTLKVFSRARGQHRLRTRQEPVGFGFIAAVIAEDTGLDLCKVKAALAGGFSSTHTQKTLAAWTGLRLATKHGAPVLVADLGAAFEPGPGGGVAPVSVEEARRRVDGRKGAA